MSQKEKLEITKFMKRVNQFLIWFEFLYKTETLFCVINWMTQKLWISVLCYYAVRSVFRQIDKYRQIADKYCFTLLESR